MTTTSSTMDYQLVPDWPSVPDGVDHRDVAGVATDSDDNVHVLVRTQPQHRVLVYSSSGEYLRSWGEGIVAFAHGITIRGDLAYLADIGDHTVRRCSIDGELQLTLGTENVPSDTGYRAEAPANLTTIRRAAGPFNRPARACATRDGQIFVADGYGNARVHRFSPDGELMQSWGEPGTAPGQFNGPHSIIDHDDKLFVCDRGNDRVQIFSHEGELLEIWPDITRASDICIGQDGTVVIGELLLREGRLGATGKIMERDRPSLVGIRDLDGKLVSYLGGGDDPLDPGNFASAHGVCMDSVGNLYVGEVTETVLSPRVSGKPESTYRPGLKTIQKFARAGVIS